MKPFGALQTHRGDSLAYRILKSTGLMALGFAAMTIPLRVLLRRELRDVPADIGAQGWPIQLAELLFLRYVLQWIRVEGLENLPERSYLLAPNHPYKSGVDGFILGHLLATKTGRVARIVITGESRSWAVSAERWILHHYGIALLVPPGKLGTAEHRGLTDVIANYLRQTPRHSVIIFPAGRAAADPEEQLKGWSTGVIVSAQKSVCPIVPVAIGGLDINATPETVLMGALHAPEGTPPFEIVVRFGKPIEAGIDTQETLDCVRSAIAELMSEIPGLTGDRQVEISASARRRPSS